MHKLVRTFYKSTTKPVDGLKNSDVASCPWTLSLVDRDGDPIPPQFAAIIWID